MVKAVADADADADSDVVGVSSQEMLGNGHVSVCLVAH